MKAIDLFAGLGGFTEGAEQAGVQVVWAANHWSAAVETHAANHPHVEHLCQDLHQAAWPSVPAHDLLLASPACTGHTPARGKERPHHDAARSTAWAIVSALECHRPRLALVENVPAFLRWSLFPSWCSALHALGYAVSPHMVDAADLGVPQHRVRALIALTRSKSPLRLSLQAADHVPASRIIDFPAGRWSPINRPGRSRATLARVAAGRARFGDRFVAPFYRSGSGLTGRSIDRPIGTITTRDRWAIVDGERMRMLSVTEARRAMAFRDDYKLPSDARLAMHMLGNAIPPLMAQRAIEAIERAA